MYAAEGEAMAAASLRYATVQPDFRYANATTVNWYQERRHAGRPARRDAKGGFMPDRSYST